MAGVEPFPWASLPSVSRASVLAGQRVRAGIDVPALAAVVGNMAGELAGADVTITVRGIAALDLRRLRPDAVGTIFAPTDALGLRGGFLVLAESALAASLVAQALRLRAPKVVDATKQLPAIAGAFAATLHAVVRRASTVPWRVLAAGPAPALAGDLAQTSANVVHVTLGVALGGASYDAGVVVALETLPEARVVDLAALGDTPLPLAIVGAICVASRIELALNEGDVFLVPGLAPTGEVVLIAPRSEVGLVATLADPSRLVIRKQRAVRPWDRAETSMPEPKEDATLEALENAPVVVRVELGVVELPARAWAALSDGDVLTLGRKLGEPAILRVGGAEVARGELVQIDGEYGVRIRRGGSR